MKNKVFVGGLSWNTSEDSLESAFTKLGEISEIKVIRDRETGKSRGFGFVTFVDSMAADRAVEEFDGTELDGRSLRVNIAEERKPPRQSSGSGHGDGGGFRAGGNARSSSRW